MKKFLKMAVFGLVVLCGLTAVAWAGEFQMIDANNFLVAAGTNKDAYKNTEPITIFAKIENLEKDQYIKLQGLKCEYIITRLDGAVSKQGVIELTRQEDFMAAAAPNSTTLKRITVYEQKGSSRLPPGQYYLSISFIDPYHNNIHLGSGVKIITVTK